MTKNNASAENLSRRKTGKICTNFSGFVRRNLADFACESILPFCPHALRVAWSLVLS
jgi:hypothetical protein